MNEAIPAAEEVFEALHALMHTYRIEQHRAMQRGEDDLAHMHGKVLGFFARHPGSTLKDLAAHVGRDKGQLARVIADARHRGLLDARVDEADRRSVRLALTAAGRHVQQTFQQRARALAEQAVARMSAAERRDIVALLSKLRDGLAGDA